MSDQNLRKKIIRLAYQKPELRRDLLPLIQKQAKKSKRQKALEWVNDKIQSLDNQRIPNSRNISSTVKGFNKIIQERISFYKDSAEEYARDAEEFKADGLMSHSKNALDMSKAFSKRQAGWEGIKVSKQIGELINALYKAKKLLTN